MTFRAFWSVMIFYDDLLEPGRTGQIGFVTTNAMTAGGLYRQDVRIIAVLPAHAVAAFAGKCLVRILRELVQNVGVTFIARLLARKNRFTRRNLRQRISAIPAILAEGRRDQKRACGKVGTNDGESQQD